MKSNHLICLDYYVSQKPVYKIGSTVAKGKQIAGARDSRILPERLSIRTVVVKGVLLREVPLRDLPTTVSSKLKEFCPVLLVATHV